MALHTLPSLYPRSQLFGVKQVFRNRTSRLLRFFAKKIFWWFFSLHLDYWAPVMRERRVGILQVTLDPMECQWRMVSSFLIVTFDFHLKWLFCAFPSFYLIIPRRKKIGIGMTLGRSKASSDVKCLTASSLHHNSFMCTASKTADADRLSEAFTEG